MQHRLDERVIIVTGAARGQGFAHACRLLEEGARVLLTDVQPVVDATALDSFGADRWGFVTHDVSDPRGWAEVAAEAIKRFGRIDGLVNNAGISSRPGIGDISAEEWGRVIAINQTGVMLGMQTVAPHLQAAGGGSIVNVSSLWAHTGGVGGGNIGYVATKAAVLGMTRNAALDFGKFGIRVNSISPGYLNHLMQGIPDPTVEAAIPRIPLGYLAEVSDMSGAVAFLVSDDARYVTGIDLMVDGGPVSYTHLTLPTTPYV